MFFLVAIIFIFQIILLAVIISFLLNVDISILLLIDKFEMNNVWMRTKMSTVENIFTDLKFILIKKFNKIDKKQKKILISQIINILEWLLLLFVKPKGKKFLLGYKFSKLLYKELSTMKNMV